MQHRFNLVGGKSTAGLVRQARHRGHPIRRLGDDRKAAFTEFAEAMQEQGPFVPLIVPGRNISSAGDVTGAVYNSVWEMDIAEIAPAG